MELSGSDTHKTKINSRATCNAILDSIHSIKLDGVYTYYVRS